MVPFAAIVSGRQRIAWQELPVKGLIVALAAAVMLRMIHDWIFANSGLFVIAGVIGGAGILGLLSSLRSGSKTHRTSLSDARPADTRQAVDGGHFMRST